MPMDILTQTTPAVSEVKQHTGSTSFTMTEGGVLKIETTGNGDEILELEVPAGKTWKALIKVNIIET